MKHEEPLSCRGTTWLVSEARDRELTALEMGRLYQHINGCPHCQIASQQFRILFAQLDALFTRRAK